MGNKYKLTEESINYCDKTLYRIEALKDFGNVKKGDKGGYVQSEENLSQEGDCWISDNAKVYNNAQVYNNALVFDNAVVYGNTIIAENALVCGDAQVFANAYVYGDATVCCKARVYGNALVFGNATVYCKAKIYGNAQVFDDAQVSDNAKVYGNAKISGSAEIKDNSDYIVFKNWWSSGRYFTWTRSNNMWRVGCFYGTGKELIAKAYKDSELSGREYKRIVGYVESILQDTKRIGD